MNDLFQTGALPDLVEKDLSKIESRKTIAWLNGQWSAKSHNESI
jgi:hypothetical protein